MNALREYMQAIIAGRKPQPVRLFFQYAQLLQLAGADRIHPADLWEQEFEWRDIQAPGAAAAQALAHQNTAVFDRALLQFLRGQGALAAASLLPLLAECAAHASTRSAKCFWSIASGMAEAVARQALAVNDHVKRAFTRIGLQFRASQSGGEVSERLARDLLFFCANAKDIGNSQWLDAVKTAYGLRRYEPVDYTVAHFGAVDPALLKQAQRRVAALKELWAELSNGDTTRVKSVGEAADLVAESLAQLLPGSQSMGDSLARLVRTSLQSSEALTPTRALEVANAILFLEASLSAGDIGDAQFAERSRSLQQRLMRTLHGEPVGPLEPWMEDMYRKSSEAQTMGSVVQELKVSLSSAESALDQFFRKPEDRQPLSQVPGLLGQMRGVLSVLDYEHAAQAVAHARTTVEDWLLDSGAPSAESSQRLAQNLGALSFMIDLMAYQPAAAKALFMFDRATGEFRSEVKQTVKPVPEASADERGLTTQVTQVAAQLSEGKGDGQAHSSLAAQLETIRLEAVIADAPQIQAAADTALEALKSGDSEEAAKVLQDITAPAAPVPATDAGSADAAAPEGEDELLGIFLDEGREVAESGLQQVARLRQSPNDQDALVTLRRSFHTLKGSSRMVGLGTFGEAAWQMEQVLNGHLAEQKPASPALLDLSQDALAHFNRWLDAIGASAPHPQWLEPIRQSAEAFKADGSYLPIATGAVTAALPVGQPIELPHEGLVEAGIASDLTLDLAPPPAAPLPALPTLDDISLDLSEPVQAAAAPDSPVSVEAEEVSLEEFLAAAEQPVPSAQIIPLPVAPAAAAPADEDVRVIGDLRIPIPLYNIYLNEADELVRKLGTELDMWRIEGQAAVPEGAIAAAHTIAGTSATVGFRPLADIAYDLEAALMACRDQRHQPTAAEQSVLENAAEEIRRLLHQFAAGFYKTADHDISAAVARLKADWQHPAAAPELPPASEVVLSAVTESPPTPQTALLPAAPVEPAPEVVPAAAQALAEAAAEVAAQASPPAPSEPVPAAAPAPAVPPIEAPATPPLTLPAQVAALQSAADDGAADQVDPDLFPIFEEEGQELLPALAQALRNWQRSPDDAQFPKQALRVLHTFKGSARLAGAMRLGDLAHQLETEVEGVLRGDTTAQAIGALVEQSDEIVNRFEQLRRGEVHSAHEFEYQAAAPAAVAEAPAEAAPMPAGAAPAAVPSFRLSQTAAAVQQAAGSRANQAVRVRAGLLDRLFNQAGEVSITRARLENELGQLKGSLVDLTDNLARLRQQLRDIELQAETQMQSRMAASKDSIDFDPLEFDRFTRFQELTRMMAESVNDVAAVQQTLNRTLQTTEDDLQRQARMTRELQRDLLRTRMVEFESLSERLYRVVRQAAKELGKSVRLDIEGGQIEIDRGVLERMSASFEHLLRNCVAHGIESPEERLRAGKPETGQIRIALKQEGNEVTLTFSDDGAGLDFDKIRGKAEKQGLLAAGAQASPEALAELIFTPGFSTAESISEIAGRGIGMDVVKSEILGLGGRVTVSTEPRQGTTFTLVLPLTTAVTQIVLVRMGELTIGVPSSLVEIVQRIKLDELNERYRTGLHHYGNTDVDFHSLAALLQAPVHGGSEGRTNPIIVVRSAAQRVAVHVDEILGNQEVVVRNLGPQLSRVPGLAGMSVLASGAVVLIYNPVALASVYGPSLRQRARQAVQIHVAQAAAPSQPAMSMAAREPTVMVVDDSLTVRRVTQRFLQRNGYKVVLAKDGLDALEILQGEVPDVMLLDIEMPRMDGFDLTRNLRSVTAGEKLRALPIIMITSRIADKHRTLAKELGVNHYLGKPYNEEELLSLIRRYTGAEALVG
jgi:chemosensory pili system protein ChpA (sensor histidine kinase/response regulator)